MNKTQSTEYTTQLKQGGIRSFDSRAKARDFIEENQDRIRGRIEKRVWDHSKGTYHQEVDQQKTELVKIEDFMEPRKSD